MRFRFLRTFSVAVSTAALVAAMAIGYASGIRAQQNQPSNDAQRDLVARQLAQREGVVLSGENIGFRVESRRNGSSGVRGKLVVRVNGQWVDAYATSDYSVIPAK